MQDIADKSSEKPVRGRTRYQTRRASQGLLSSIENSESDSSEAKEESSKMFEIAEEIYLKIKQD